MKKLRHEEILHHAEEDWEDPEQREDPKNIKPDLPFSMQTRQSGPERPAKKYNPYRYDLIAYRMDLKKSSVSRRSNSATGSIHCC